MLPIVDRLIEKLMPLAESNWLRLQYSEEDELFSLGKPLPSDNSPVNLIIPDSCVALVTVDLKQAPKKQHEEFIGWSVKNNFLLTPQDVFLSYEKVGTIAYVWVFQQRIYDRLMAFVEHSSVPIGRVQCASQRFVEQKKKQKQEKTKPAAVILADEAIVTIAVVSDFRIVSLRTVTWKQGTFANDQVASDAQMFLQMNEVSGVILGSASAPGLTFLIPGFDVVWE